MRKERNMLDIESITKHFGGLVAVSKVSMTINRGEIFSLIGPNGAGKTTLFNMIAGVSRPDSGKIQFKEQLINGLKPYQVCSLGVARTFQVVKPFTEATVLENVMVGAFNKTISVTDAVRLSKEILKSLGLESKIFEHAHELSIGDRKRLEVARALATKPQLLLLDEPMGGLTAGEREVLIDAIKAANRNGVTVFLIEHVMDAVMKLSEKVGVLNYGKLIFTGLPKDAVNNKEVIAAYLGEDY